LKRSSADYVKERDDFDVSQVVQRKYGDSCTYLIRMIKQQWERYFSTVGSNPEQALVEFDIRDLVCFFRWLIRESHGTIDSSRSVQTYWNVLCIVRRQETGLIDMDPVLKHQMMNARQQFIQEFNLRTTPKEKPIMRVEDEFECLKTLWSSREMVFEAEVHRLAMALLMQLAGSTGNRPKALLQLRFRHVSVALLPDPEGSEWPRVMIDWKFENTKGYLGQKDANEIPIPDIPNEACLLLCPHTTFLSLAFLFDAFAVTDLTPSRLYSLKIPAGQGQLLIPWKESIKDTYLFRKLLRTPLGTEMSDDHLSYDFLRTQLRKVGELTGFAFPVGAYCFRRGNGEALDNSSDISEAQRNLCLQHAPNSTVFQRNYLSRHITISTHDAFRKLPQQTELMRVATGMSRTIDKRRPRLLSPSQVEQARSHPKVQALLRLRESYKRRLKSGAGTIEQYKGTRLYEQYCKIKRAYIMPSGRVS